jgi:hypothetical protein
VGRSDVDRQTNDHSENVGFAAAERRQANTWAIARQLRNLGARPLRRDRNRWGDWNSQNILTKCNYAGSLVHESLSQQQLRSCARCCTLVREKLIRSDTLWKCVVELSGQLLSAHGTHTVTLAHPHRGELARITRGPVTNGVKRRNLIERRIVGDQAVRACWCCQSMWDRLERTDQNEDDVVPAPCGCGRGDCAAG